MLCLPRPDPFHSPRRVLMAGLWAHCEHLGVIKAGLVCNFSRRRCRRRRCRPTPEVDHHHPDEGEPNRLRRELLSSLCFTTMSFLCSTSSPEPNKFVAAVIRLMRRVYAVPGRPFAFIRKRQHIVNCIVGKDRHRRSAAIIVSVDAPSRRTH